MAGFEPLAGHVLGYLPLFGLRGRGLRRGALVRRRQRVAAEALLSVGPGGAAARSAVPGSVDRDELLGDSAEE